jgi:hypothetical protein
MTRHILRIVAISLIVIAAALLWHGRQVRAHDAQHPANNQWLKELGSPRGVCCDGSDAVRIDEPDFRMSDHAPDGSECRQNTPNGDSPKTGHYCVRLLLHPQSGVLSEKVWFLVTDDALVTGPNKDGVVRVWPIATASADSEPVTTMGIRCFLEGAGT